MKFYQDNRGVFWLNGITLPSGTYILDPSKDYSEVSIYPYDRDTKKLLPTIYNKPVIEFEDESGTPYTDYTSFYEALSDFFVKALTPGGIITVAQFGADFKTVKDAIESIDDNSIDMRYTIQVTGVTLEDNPIQGKSYVTVIGTGDNNTARIQAANPNEDLFIGANLFYIEDVSLYGVTGTSKYAVNHSAAGEMVLKSVVITDCSNGVLNGSDNSIINIIDSAVYTPNTSTDKALHVTGGNVYVNTFKNILDSTLTTFIDASGANTKLTILSCITESPNVTTAFKFSDGIKVVGNGNTIYNAYDGHVLSGNDVDVRLDGTKIIGAQNHGFRIENVGTNIKLGGTGNTVIDSTVYNYVIDNPNCLIYGFGFTNTTKSRIVAGVKFIAALLDDTVDDESLNILGELRVGSASRPAESCFGEGDSYVTGMVVYTETDLGVATDVTEEASSSKDSTFEFTGTSAGHSIYMSSMLRDTLNNPLKFFGFKISVDTAAVLGSGNFIIEYYNAINGWTETNFMDTQADRRYYQYGKDLLTHLGAHQVRGPIELVIEDDPNLTWDSHDPFNLGINTYWIRIRVENAITSSPAIQQIKLHSNRSEFNADGWLEHFGSARPKGSLNVTIGAGRELSGNLQSSNVWIDTNLGAGLVNNRFANSTQFFGIGGSVPDDLDTGSSVELVIYARGEAAGAATLNVDYGFITEGDSMYGVNTATGIKKSVTASTTYTAANEVKVFRFPLDFSGVRVRKDPSDGTVEPDLVYLTISAITIPTGIILANIEVDYYKWCEGGHI